MINIILASQSPRRKQLLEWADISFEVKVANTDESYDENLPQTEIPIQIAFKKAETIAANNKESCVIAADTIVCIKDKILNKPVDKDDALKMLQMLNGKSHNVITGVVIIYKNKTIKFSETTLVEFNELSTQQLINYIDNYKPYDKAGAYAIQEWIGVVGIKSITGDFYNVMGLPINRIYKELTILKIF